MVSTPAYPWWTAQLDGQAVPLRSIEGVLPAVHVGPGTHQLTYAYAPSTVRNGMMLGSFRLFLASAWLVGYLLLRKPRRRPAPFARSRQQLRNVGGVNR